MKKMQIFEPAMCCSTGLCGVSLDPELLRISTVLNTLEKNGIRVERFNLTNAPDEFIKNQTVNKFLNEKGVDDLPVIIIDDEIVITGRYPKNDEFVKLLGLPANILNIQPRRIRATMKKSKGCDCSKGNCC